MESVRRLSVTRGFVFALSLSYSEVRGGVALLTVEAGVGGAGTVAGVALRGRGEEGGDEATGAGAGGGFGEGGRISGSGVFRPASRSPKS